VQIRPGIVSRTLLGALAGACLPALVHAADMAAPGWALGLPVRITTTPPTGAGRPSPDIPDARVYMVAPTDETAPHRPQASIPTPEGVRILPPHLEVLAELAPAGAVREAQGVFVVSGPKATADRVRTGGALTRSLAGAPLASALRIDDVWVPLTSAVVIDYGVRVGLLEIRPFGFGGVQSAEAYEAASLGAFTASLSQGKAPAPAAEKPDLVRDGWYMGMPVHMNVLLPSNFGGRAPPAPTPGKPVIRVYITGPVRDDKAFTPETNTIPTPDGPRTLPPHDDTLTRLPPPDERPDGEGLFVAPGPNASPATVKARDAPKDSIVGAPLAYAIQVGGQWLPLNNHVVIEYGLRRGLLKTVSFGYGGSMWSSFVDPLAADYAPDVKVMDR